jgi:serine/threonine-protein kinase HipA
MDKNKTLSLEVFTDNVWHLAAELSCTDQRKGYKSQSSLVYVGEYVDEHLMKNEIHAVSCKYPVSFTFHKEESWPAFILDIMPSGAGRRFWLSKLDLPNNATSDWALLSAGSSNSPGNIRIKSNSEGPPVNTHPGFSTADILERNEDFISYALESGAPVTGSSGAQGDAPKFLLTQDDKDRWHADGALSDKEAKKHWIVKFPRGRHESDRKILRNEAEYMNLASLLGLHVSEVPHFKNDALFIPRFDRVIVRKADTREVQRLGLESLCSASGVSEFGHIFKLEELCMTIAAFSTNALEDVLEFIFRDILNIICGNTDNHGRNSSLLKYPDGSIRLAPLYDFAPMYLDREGIARLHKWRHFEGKGMLMVQDLQKWLVTECRFEKTVIEKRFMDFREKLAFLPDMLLKTNIDEDIQLRIKRALKTLEKVW